MSLSLYGIIFLFFNSIAVITISRRWAPLPFILAACYMTLGQGIKIGPFNFYVFRILIAVSLLRIIFRGEYHKYSINGLDWLILGWSGWLLFSGIFHNPDPYLPSPIIFRLGVVYNVCGIYFILRIFCQTSEDVVRLIKITTIVLLPLAIEMLYEKITIYNLFSVLGGVSESPQVRMGKVRAQGPFAHPILAGTVGAVTLPLMIGIWKIHRKSAFIGIIACSIIVIASASSGPFMSAITSIIALLLWQFRQNMRLLRWLAIIFYIGLELVMKAPAYFLLARIDISGGSTGWHRAELIQAGIKHLDEWWLIGTDYTRHWMPTGVSWNPNHTDITNQYLGYGALGGLLLMLFFIAILAKGFSYVGEIVNQKNSNSSQEDKFLAWALGASLFAHASTFISVSYFDQSIIFLYITLAVIGSLWSKPVVSCSN